MVYGLDPTLQTSATGGGIDISTGTTFGEIMAKNSSSQALQEQQVAEAIEKVKQAKIGTKRAQAEFDAETYLSDKGLMQKPQLLGQLKIVMVKEHMPESEIDRIMQIAEETLPDVMDGRNLYQWWSALKNPAALKTKEVIATAEDAKTKKDQSGEPVVAGRGYVVDDEDIWRISGKSQAEIDAETANKASQAAARAAPRASSAVSPWERLVKRINPGIAGPRSNYGQAYNAMIAADRGISLLDQPKVTVQNMREVTSDLTRILTGGVPTDHGIESMTYRTIMGDIAESIQYYTGEPQKAIPDDLKHYLTDSFNRLKSVSMDVVQKAFTTEETAFPALIDENRSQWEGLKKLYLEGKNPHMAAYSAKAAAEPPAKEGAVSKAWSGLTASDKPAPPAGPTTDDPLGLGIGKPK